MVNPMGTAPPGLDTLTIAAAAPPLPTDTATYRVAAGTVVKAVVLGGLSA